MVSAVLTVLVVSLLLCVLSTAQQQFDPRFGSWMQYTQPKRNLRLIQVVRRHGDRAVYTPFPGDPYASYWVDGASELTNKGERKQYDFGVYLRETYPEILKSDLKPSEIQVVSSDTPRSIDSADLNLAGIFVPLQRQVWNDKLGRLWRPVPVQTIPKGLDNLFYMDGKICPTMDTLRKTIKDLPIGRKVFAQQKDFLNVVQQNTKQDMDSFWDGVYAIYDWIDVMMNENLPLPTWISPAFIKRVTYLDDLFFHMTYGDNSNVQRTRLEGGALTNLLINQMVGSFPQGNTTGNGKKFILYSAHDNTVVAQLSALRSYNYTEAGSPMPEVFFGANLVYELYDDQTVRIRLQNNPNDALKAPAVTVIVPGCTEYCPLAQLAQLVSPFMVTRAQWLSECGAPPDPSNFKYPYNLPVDTRAA